MFISNQGTHLYAVSFGKSERTILGIGGWAGSWELWAEPFSDLSQNWCTIAFDHRGTGATIAAIESITVQNMVDDIFTVLDTYQVEKCVIAAESMGSITALLAVLQQPHRFQGMIIVGGFTSRTKPSGTDPFVEGLKHNFEATISQFVDACVPEPNSDAERHWGRQILRRASQASAVQLYESIYGIDLTTQLSEVTVPTLVLHGELDAIVPVENARFLASNLPNAQLQTFPNTGHVPTVTRPHEVSQAIDTFFKRLL